jgi:hypothetical protein
VAPHSRDEIRETSSILNRRERSQSYIDGNYEILLDKYGEKEIVVVSTEDDSEIAAVYDSESENNWEKALSAIRETYGEKTYLSAVARELEEK